MAAKPVARARTVKCRREAQTHHDVHAGEARALRAHGRVVQRDAKRRRFRFALARFLPLFALLAPLRGCEPTRRTLALALPASLPLVELHLLVAHAAAVLVAVKVGERKARGGRVAPEHDAGVEID